MLIFDKIFLIRFERTIPSYFQAQPKYLESVTNSTIISEKSRAPMKRKTFGTCALTGETGQFIKSHLIPRALTRLSKTGEKRIQSEIGGRATRTSDSWYDLKLVTQAGEDILSDIDSRGIDELRRLRLIWSGLNGQQPITNWSLDEGPSIREVHVTNSATLRIFFLSLLWRAGATKLDHFRHVQLTSNEIEDLRSRILAREPGPFDDFPILLYQLTEGPAHNRVPLLVEEETQPNSGDQHEQKITYVRFYFDGLIARIYLKSRQKIPDHYSKICIQDNNNFIVFVHRFEDSRAKNEIVSIIRDYEQKTMNPFP
jgi:hypothetical protein